MTDIRAGVHEEIDQLSNEELVRVKKFLGTYPDLFAAVLRRGPLDDEPLAEAERPAIQQTEEWLAQSGGGIPH